MSRQGATAPRSMNRVQVPAMGEARPHSALEARTIHRPQPVKGVLPDVLAIMRENTRLRGENARLRGEVAVMRMMREPAGAPNGGR